MPPATYPYLLILWRLHFASMIYFMNFETWLDTLIGDDTRAMAAKKTQYSQSTISRQLSRGYLRPETVIALCRAYGLSPITGLIQTEYIDESELEGVDIPAALNRATNEQILEEILKRSDPEARSFFGKDKDEDVIDLYETSPFEGVTDFPYSDVGGMKYAANKRKPEPRPGDDDYSPGA